MTCLGVLNREDMRRWQWNRLERRRSDGNQNYIHIRDARFSLFRFCHLLTATITFLVYASLCAIIFHANLFWRRIRTRRYSMSSVSVSLYTVWCCSSSIRALCSCACNSSNCFLDNISRWTQLSNMALVDSLFSFNLLDIDSEELEAVCVLFKKKIIKNAIEKQEWSQ